MTSSFSVVIPARLNSSRLPDKLLLPIAGKPMLFHVIERALQSAAARVIVAVDDDRLGAVVTNTEATPVMTSINHESGTDRIFESIEDLGLGPNDLIVNVQGDEPLIPPRVINQVAQLLADRPCCGVATLYSVIDSPQAIFDSNVVKIVRDSKADAMYFSRAPVPWDRDNFQEGCPESTSQIWLHHIGIYAYRVWALRKFATWQPSRLEQVERLEQLRFLENGISIATDEAVEAVPAGVDTPQDLARVRKHFSSAVD